MDKVVLHKPTLFIKDLEEFGAPGRDYTEQEFLEIHVKTAIFLIVYLLLYNSNNRYSHKN